MMRRMRPEDCLSKSGSSHTIPHILSYFIAVGANTGTESGEKRGGIATVMPFHPRDDLLKKSFLRPLPAAMDGCDHAPVRVVNEDGKTIRRFDDEEKTGKSGHKSISLEVFPGHPVDEMNDVGMDLAEVKEMEFFPCLSVLKVLFEEGPIPESMAEIGKPVQLRDGQDRFYCFRVHHVLDLYLTTASYFKVFLSFPFRLLFGFIFLILRKSIEWTTCTRKYDEEKGFDGR